MALTLFASDSIDIVVGLGRDLVSGSACGRATCRRRGHGEDATRTSAVHRAVDDRRRRSERDPRCPAHRARPRHPDLRRRRVAARSRRPTPRRSTASRVRRRRPHRRRPRHPALRRASSRSRSASRPAGAAWVRGRRSRGRPRRACSRSTGGRRSSSTSGTSAPVRRRSPTRWRSSRRPAPDRFYLRTPMAFDRDRGSIGFFGAVPEGATVQLTVAGTDEIFEGAKASFADALATFPDGHPAGRRAPVLVRDAQVPAGDARRSRDRARPRGPWGNGAGRRVLLHGRDRADGLGRPVAIPQRHDGLGPARLHVRGRDRPRLDDRAGRPRSGPASWRRRTSDSPDASSGSRTTSAGSRQFQDSNATLASRLLTELEEERARSQRLLLNVLPQRIVDRLDAGETLIADRHDRSPSSSATSSGSPRSPPAWRRRS